MNRNVESHFSELPKVDINRSIFDRSSSHKTSFNVGQLIPFFVDEVLPGDTFKVTTSVVARLQTLLTPIMDNVYLDTYYFYIPCRILWKHWKEFMGENTTSPWLPAVEYNIPTIKPPSGGWAPGSIADYLGIPIGVFQSDASHVINYPSHLPFRAYAKIVDEFFRDQNLQNPLTIEDGDLTTNGSNGSNFVTDVQKGGLPFQVAKYHDYFTSCLPAPQKGPSVGLFPSNSSQGVGQLGAYWNHYVPVYARNNNVTFDNKNPVHGIKWQTDLETDPYATYVITGTNPDTPNIRWSKNAVTGDHTMSPANLWADMSQSLITINELRMAFQLQKYYEKNARAGTRYREILKEHFGVTSSDARMMIPEYLGGHRIPLSIHQIANQASSSGEYLGDLGAMSNTADIHEDFIKSFEEHGYVMGVCCVRYDHSYPQGLEKLWLRRHKLDYYWPVFANLGEQIVYKDEIYWREYTDDSDYKSNAVFGYQEAWADYRYKPSRVSAEMRPGIANSLATWHLSDYYLTQPSLSSNWIKEDLANVDRVLAVGHTVSNQVFADFYIKNIVTRPMPVYSIPGLIDHH